MSDFHDLFGDFGLPLLMDVHGETIVYCEDGGDPRTIAAIVGEERETQVPLDDGEEIEVERDVTVYRDATLGIDCPSLTATVTYQQREYAVRRVPVITASHVKLVIVRREMKEQTRRGYRRRT
jgi:hypothetical protein